MTSVGASTAITDVSSVSEMLGKFDDASLTDSGYSGDPSSCTSPSTTWDSRENAKKGCGRPRVGPHSPCKSTQSTPSSCSTSARSKASHQLLVPEISSRGSGRRASFH